MSIAGEVLAQWIHQGVDVWHAGPIGTFVEEEVTALAPRPGRASARGRGACSRRGGVMANLMALDRRPRHLAREAPRHGGPPRGAALEGVRVYASDQTHFSIARALGRARVPARDAAW